MKKTKIGALVALSLSCVVLNVSAHDEAPKDLAFEQLPVQYEAVFEKAMNDPNVVLYHSDMAYRKGDFNSALRWALDAAQYNHPGAIANAKFMIQKNQGTFENREGVIDFLRYYAEPRVGSPADLFAQLYLADYYRGDNCVWFKNTDKDCAASQDGPMSATDLARSYFYYEGAAKQGDNFARYNAGMMHLLAQGVPRNVPLALEWLTPIADGGNPHIAFIMGSVNQTGYWVPKDEVKARYWFEKAAEVAHPSAMIELAKIMERGVAGDEIEAERYNKAIELYSDVLSGVLASEEERAEASYRLGLIYGNYAHARDDDKALALMQSSAGIIEHNPNENSVLALMWLGNKAESTSLKKAVKLYANAIKWLETMPIDVQQRYASVYQRVAHAYARGMDGDLDRDQRRFSQYMSRQHQILSESYVPKRDLKAYKGYSLFHFPS